MWFRPPQAGLSARGKSLRLLDLRYVERLPGILDQLGVGDWLLHRRDLEGHVRNLEPLVIFESGLLIRERNLTASSGPLQSLQGFDHCLWFGRIGRLDGFGDDEHAVGCLEKEPV